jgi:cytochrome c553
MLQEPEGHRNIDRELEVAHRIGGATRAIEARKGAVGDANPATFIGPESAMNHRLCTCTALAAALSLAAPAACNAAGADGAPASAALCFSCHGPAGNPIARDYPILTGQQRDYLVAALGAYRAAQRTGSPNAQAMTAVAKGLTDAEIAELADWFAMVRR